MSYIYVASPYSGSELQQRDRYAKVEKFVAEWTRRGQILYSPIVHFHFLAMKYELPTVAEFWHEHNISMLRHAKQLWVYTLPGWETSKGVAFELNIAHDLLIPVLYKALPGWKEETNESNL